MGCNAIEVALPSRISTVTGNLTITIQDGELFHETSVFKMDPYLVVRVSNQCFKTDFKKNAGKKPTFDESFKFVINSCYKINGRKLEIEVWDKNKLVDSEVGFGILDLDPIINFKKKRESARCFINFGRENAGYLNMIIEFRECESKMVNFRPETALLRRRTRTVSDMNVSFRITIGEEVL